MVPCACLRGFARFCGCGERNRRDGLGGSGCAVPVPVPVPYQSLGLASVDKRLALSL
jgi:hypothetical protein